MKTCIWLIGIIGLCFGVCSCKKGNELGEAKSTSSLTLVNLISNSNGIITNFSGTGDKGDTTSLQFYSIAAQIGYGSFQEFSSFTGSQPLLIVSATDTFEPEWSGVLNLGVGSIQSLYLYGPDTLHIDTLLTIDNPPYYSAGDSVVGVRFIHLAYQQNAVSIDIQGGAGSPLAGNLPYKGVTAFNSLPYTSTNPVSGQYVFEFRDAISDSLLATYAYSATEYKNVSVVLGTISQNGTTSFTTILVNDY